MPGKKHTHEKCFTNLKKENCTNPGFSIDPIRITVLMQFCFDYHPGQKFIVFSHTPVSYFFIFQL